MNMQKLTISPNFERAEGELSFKKDIQQAKIKTILESLRNLDSTLYETPETNLWNLIIYAGETNETIQVLKELIPDLETLNLKFTDSCDDPLFCLTMEEDKKIHIYKANITYSEVGAI